MNCRKWNKLTISVPNVVTSLNFLFHIYIIVYNQESLEYTRIQDVSGRIVNILGGGSMNYSE